MYIFVRSIRSTLTSFQNPDYIQVNQKDQFRHKYLIILGVLLYVSSVFSFLIHVEMFMKINYLYKIPVYSCLGTSCTFALCITIMDIINMIFHLIQPKDSKPIINSSKQVR